MKSSSSRRSRRRQPSVREAGNPQQDQKKDQKFFGPESREPFFQPVAAIHRAPEAKAEEKKKEEKVSRAPEEKKEEKISKAPEEKKEDKTVMKLPEDAPEKDKEKEKLAKAPETKQEDEKEKDKKVSREALPTEKKEEEKKVSKKGEAGGAGDKTVRYVEGIGGKGRPLGSTERDYFGERLGYDFGAVRIHTGEEAAQSARDAGAKAYTYGNHVVFSEGRFNFESLEGRRLLAHELAHVVQQNPGSKSGKEGGHEKGSVGTRGNEGAPTQNSVQPGFKTAAPGQVHRQQGTTTAAPVATPTDRGLFRSRLLIALSQMRTPTVAAETLGGTFAPVLRDMADNAEWVDSTGASSGGAEVSIGLPHGGRRVRLRLVLDDVASPSLQGRFDSTGADLGVIRVFVRQNLDADNLATTLYHESLHLMRWLASHSPGGNFQAETGATGGRRLALEGIDPARQPQHLANVRRRVSDLADSVNVARPTADRVNATGIDRLSNFVMEEYLTRVETEVFRLMRDSDAVAGRVGASVRIGTSPDRFFPRADVDKYLFEFISVFRVGDRAALGDYDRVLIDNLYQYFRDRVQMFVSRRYSEVIHGPNFP